MAIQYCDYDIKGTLAVTGTSTFAGDLILDANSGSSPDIFFYNVSNNYARMLFDTSDQFVIKIGTTNEMTMSATATTFDSSITATSAVLSGPSDSMLTLNQTGTDTGWSYINFQTSNVRNYYVGQDSSKNFNIYNDVIDVLGFSMSYTDANITLGADLIVGGGDITLSGTGRIQGIDTVSASTDAANKAYVDAHDGGAGVYLPLAGGTMVGNLKLNDSVQAQFGTSSDFKVYHDGSSTYLENSTGNMYIMQRADNADMYLQCDNGSGGDANYLYLDGGIESIMVNKDMLLFNDGNGGKLKFGASQDLQIYHDGTNSYVENDTGDLYIRNNFQDRDIILQSDDGGGGVATYIQLDGSTGGVDLNHYGSNKLKTTSDGVAVIGTCLADDQFQVKNQSGARYTVVGDTDTGLGNFDGSGRLSLLSNNKEVFTAKDDKNIFNAYVSTSVATTGSLSANQSQQALTSDTLANLTVDPTGNIVRGSQEGTWTFTKAQIDALTTSTTSGTTLIAAPGADKAIIVEESNLMIRYSGTGTMSSNSFVIRQAHNGDATAEITRLPSGQINTIMSSAPTNPSYGFYSRDLPLYNNDGRSFVTNKATFLTRISTNATPTNLVSISIKLKYRIFNASTF